MGEHSTIDIEFYRSTSKFFKDAVALSQAQPSFKTEGEGATARYAASFKVEEINKALKLWEVVSGWKGTRMLFQKKEISKKDLVYGPLGCFRKRLSSKNPKKYCSGEKYSPNFWGCKKIDVSAYDIFTDQSEYGFSKPIGPNKISINKEAILKAFNLDETTLSICPAFSVPKIKAAIETLPEQIHVPSYSGPFLPYIKDWKNEIKEEARWEKEEARMDREMRAEIDREQNAFDKKYNRGRKNNKSNIKYWVLFVFVIYLIIKYSG